MALAARLRRALRGEVRFSAFDRGRYSTDASIYQIEPIGVVIPRDADDVRAAIEIARGEGVPVLPRGAGTSQCGQAVGEALVLDTSKYMRDVLELDAENGTAWVQPGIVLDHLNKHLKTSGWTFPIDVSPTNRATIGGMTANNSCGARSIKYGIMLQNVLAIDATLADGSTVQLGPTPGNLAGVTAREADIAQRLANLYAREEDEIRARTPTVLRNVGGYRLETLGGGNLAKILVGSEGTLGFFNRIKLQLHRIPTHRVQAICHFARFTDAMATTQYIVQLNPSAVELVDRTMIELARNIPAFASTIERAVKGNPDALLLVEFAGDNRDALLDDMQRLDQLLSDHGFPDAIVPATDPGFQTELAEVRAAGLNIMMSMKGDGKPVSFIEDCAVPLEHLADYTSAITDCFGRHGLEGTWYAHASVGCLHVRPVLNMKDDADLVRMRAIAEEAIELVRKFKGAFSGEHGDGLVRSEFLEKTYGPRITDAYREVKQVFDPDGLFNPGKIVDPPRMDDRRLMRYGPDYAAVPFQPALDWSEWGGFLGAVEMCNNNGTCRKREPGTMCPSYRVTQDETHVTRGRANTLRLALSGQLGPDALASDDMAATLDLCVSCKGCRRECPTGVDMAKMKIEALHARVQRNGLSLRARLVAYLPRYASYAAALAPLLNLRDVVPGAAWLSERLLGFSARRSLPKWRFRPHRATTPREDGRSVVLLVDTFNRWFEPENARAARRVLEAAGYRVHEPLASGRPLCCGRTFLSAGLVDEARSEAKRMLDALAPYVETSIPIIGLEPSCLLTLRDEFSALLPGDATRALSARAVLFEEFLAAESKAGRLSLKLKPLAARDAFLHGHCHQKSFGVMPATVAALKLVPELNVQQIESSCCGMAGAFGYEAAHYDVSMAMAELSLLPTVRKAPTDALIVADGTSCRHQIGDGAAREAVHVARVLEMALI
ncbi:glycolate oxidase [Rhodospirillales bacterium TMPK1]|uniref:Glycolate oxidase n=1 Tax=Roseiterribacter gracilis TaxID=2812848 RepID=A0A8S8XDP5_9PROT|nr:glycolate oxidase [Rhodospirillales bacterium TMPK1]